MKIFGNIVDLVKEEVFQGYISVENGKIVDVKKEENSSTVWILPGFIDSHIHIESSMLKPSEFARLAVTHGTVATISDPHEIANVLGLKGVEFMIENGRKVPLDFFFGASSCVPATPFETSGATLGNVEIEALLKRDDIIYLSEMMNYPAVIAGDSLVMDKINIAKKYNKPIDGHAPCLRGDDLKKYIDAGITTDHESVTFEEAEEKLENEMKILIREGSATKNFEALVPLFEKHSDNLMFCSDDLHPNDLVKGHINLLIKRAIAKGFNPLKVLKAACYNPQKHYGIDIGLLQKGDNATFVIADNFSDFNILETVIKGELVAKTGNTLLKSFYSNVLNNFSATKLHESQIELQENSKEIFVIGAEDRSLMTKKVKLKPKVVDGKMVSDIENDILKIVVLNRYFDAEPAVAFVYGFGLKKGAIASSIAHDSHNIIAVGVDDDDIISAINLLVEAKGGISLCDKSLTKLLKLQIAGLMSVEDGYKVAADYNEIDNFAKQFGSKLCAPFMTLSFMALLVIPSLKISDKGLFDSDNFCFC